ncbi:uncharacterized protein EI90DRAFT_3294623 [Cantharellus anzutake]|uniref:uncharacterized protein n=1 Tax=Cantharellus anzutake TaxID=1750568 RepID=UPI00190823C9|nr:uncharacterized protein EI90DRAFT_3294623 [Cantharellus anzutake]KAF8312903.1 hypothetical protein EI90DRAFT_3294623 [Cantharellus anzutake]
MSSAASSATDIPTVCILGASYGGHRAVQVLVNSLPHGWRIVVIERNTHCNHLYVFPRIAVIPGHEHKAFIPYTNIFKTSPTLTTPQTPLADPSSHVLIHGHVTAVHPHSVRYISLDQGASLEERQVRFNYLIYALGSHLPAPINIWSEEPLKNIPKLRKKYSLGPPTPTGSHAPTTASTPSTPSTIASRSPTNSLFSFAPTISSDSSTNATSTPAQHAPHNREHHHHIPASIRALGGLTIPSTPSPFNHVHDQRHYTRVKDEKFDEELERRLKKLAVRPGRNSPSSSFSSSSDLDYEEAKSEKEDDGQPYVLNAASILQHGTKPEGLLWLRSAQERVKNSESVLVIGGGALGVQFATDIKGFYGEGKEVTLVHSGDRLLPRFDKWMHEQIIVQLERLGVKVLLSSRVDLSSKTERTLRTCDGRLISAELILLCTGQKPNTSLLSKIAPHSINPRTGLVTVLRSMQIGYFERPTPPPVPSILDDAPLAAGFTCAKGLPEDECLCRGSNRFNFKLPKGLAGPSDSPSHHSIVSGNLSSSPTTTLATSDITMGGNWGGDAADAFGALNAGHTAWTQAEVASRNVIRMIESGGRAKVGSKPPCQDRVLEKGANLDDGPPSMPLRIKLTPMGNRNKIWPLDPAASAYDSTSRRSQETEDRELPELEHYIAPPPSIKISIGLDKAIYQSKGNVGFKGPEECPIDLNAGGCGRGGGWGRMI